MSAIIPLAYLCFFDNKSFDYLAKKTGFKVISIETYGLDVTDYLLFKEFKDKIDYTLKLREFISLTQSLIDKSNLIFLFLNISDNLHDKLFQMHLCLHNKL